MRVAAFRVVLRTRGDFGEFFERFGQKLRARLRQTVEQLARGFACADRRFICQQHIAGVQTLRHLHGGDARLFVACDDRPLNGGRAAPARQKRAVDVDAAVRRNVEHRLGQQLAVGDNDNDLGRQLAQACLLVLVFEGSRLIDRNVMLKRQLLDRGRGQNLLAALRLVRLRVDRRDLMTGIEQRLKARHREIRRAHENNAHYSSPSCGISTSTYSSTFSMNRWPSRCSVSWQKHCATTPSPSRSNQLP